MIRYIWFGSCTNHDMRGSDKINAGRLGSLRIIPRTSGQDTGRVRGTRVDPGSSQGGSAWNQSDLKSLCDGTKIKCLNVTTKQGKITTNNNKNRVEPGLAGLTLVLVTG